MLYIGSKADSDNSDTPFFFSNPDELFVWVMGFLKTLDLSMLQMRVVFARADSQIVQIADFSSYWILQSDRIVDSWSKLAESSKNPAC